MWLLFLPRTSFSLPTALRRLSSLSNLISLPFNPVLLSGSLWLTEGWMAALRFNFLACAGCSIWWGGFVDGSDWGRDRADDGSGASWGVIPFFQWGFKLPIPSEVDLIGGCTDLEITSASVPCWRWKISHTFHFFLPLPTSDGWALHGWLEPHCDIPVSVHATPQPELSEGMHLFSEHLFSLN